MVSIMKKENKKLENLFLEKVHNLTIFDQLKSHGEEFAIHIILDYMRCFHEYLQLPTRMDILKLSLISGLSDIKFEGSDIVFLDTNKKELLRVFAPY